MTDTTYAGGELSRARLSEAEKKAESGGGPERIAKQHASGKLTARERLTLLLDAESFVELDKLKTHRCFDFGMESNKPLGDGVVTGYGKIDGRPVFVFAQDFTVVGGSLGGAHAEKICKIMDLALENGAPVIGLNDSGGARIQEGVVSSAGYAEIFLRNTLASGVVPQISVIMGPCAGGASYSPAITDFVVMVDRTSYMFLTGPDVIRAVTHESVTKDTLGGPAAHASISGVCHLVGANDEEALGIVRELLSYLPSNNADDPPVCPTADPIDRQDEALRTLVPIEPNIPYDMRVLVRSVADDGRFLELHRDFATNLVVGFLHLDGHPVGVVANQPEQLAGCLDIQASKKGARFVRFCDAFNIPLLILEDSPGFLPGVKQEHGGVISEGAKLLYAFCEATVPKVTLITRKAYGGSYTVMSPRHTRGDIVLAFPWAEIAVMGAEGATNIIFRGEVERSENPEATRIGLIERYREAFANPYRAAEMGYIDSIILPEETRPRLARAFEMLRNKVQASPKKKHGNIPL